MGSIQTRYGFPGRVPVLTGVGNERLISTTVVGHITLVDENLRSVPQRPETRRRLEVDLDFSHPVRTVMVCPGEVGVWGQT